MTHFAFQVPDRPIPLPNFATRDNLQIMSTMNISLPQALRSFVDKQVSKAGYGTSSEYLRELIRRDQDRVRLRNLLLSGAKSKLSDQPFGKPYFEKLRDRARKRRR